MSKKSASRSPSWKLDVSHVQEAARALSAWIKPTPLVLNEWLSHLFDCEIYLKLENLHPIGSFKIRGATYRISQLTASEKKRGVLAASAGNHAQGVAWGARALGVSATIVMPQTAPLVKVINTQSLGAEVILHGRNYDEAKSHALKLQSQFDSIWIPAFEDPLIVSGQGTACLEILEQCPQVDLILGAAGGGGMLGGFALVLKDLAPQVELIGVQAQGAPSLVQSFKKGKAVRLGGVHTFADGIAVRDASQRIFQLLRHSMTNWVTVSDEEISEAVLLLLEKAKVVAEGSGAAALAALFNKKIRKRVRGKRVVVVVSGGNIDVNLLARIIDRGMIQSGRRLKVKVWLHDRPGALAELTERLAQSQANVLQAIHDHNSTAAQLDQAVVALTLDTKGRDHSREISEMLKENYDRFEEDRL